MVIVYGYSFASYSFSGISFLLVMYAVYTESSHCIYDDIQSNSIDTIKYWLSYMDMTESKNSLLDLVSMETWDVYSHVLSSNPYDTE